MGKTGDGILGTRHVSAVSLLVKKTAKGELVTKGE